MSASYLPTVAKLVRSLQAVPTTRMCRCQRGTTKLQDAARRLLDRQEHGSLEDIPLHPHLSNLPFELAHIARIDPGPGLVASNDPILLHPVPQGAGTDAEIPGHSAMGLPVSRTIVTASRNSASYFLDDASTERGDAQSDVNVAPKVLLVYSALR